jgi:hypothetical protein
MELLGKVALVTGGASGIGRTFGVMPPPHLPGRRLQTPPVSHLLRDRTT